jgi:hypothetical protein
MNGRVVTPIHVPDLVTRSLAYVNSTCEAYSTVLALDSRFPSNPESQQPGCP